MTRDMKSAESLHALLRAYQPYDAYERTLIAGFERLIDGGGAIYSRANYSPGHLTASALIVDAKRQRLGLIFHRKLQLWLQPGGHFEEGERDPLEAARREASEEIGLRDLEPLGDGLFDLDIHEIPARRDEPAHLHHDLRFAFIASGDETVKIAQSEVSDFAFIELSALIDARQGRGFKGKTDGSVRRAARKLKEWLR